MLQHASTDQETWVRSKALISRAQRRIRTMRKKLDRKVAIQDVRIDCNLFVRETCNRGGATMHNVCIFLCYMQVYTLLLEKFSACPWPVPPWAILMHLPIAEKPGVKSSECLLREMVSVDRRWRHRTPWAFENGPRPRWTYVSHACMYHSMLGLHAFSILIICFAQVF